METIDWVMNNVYDAVIAVAAKTAKSAPIELDAQDALTDALDPGDQEAVRA